MRVEGRGTALVAGLLCVVVLSGVGFYGRGEAPSAKANCYCENWKECGYDDPKDCVCCEKLGGCRPPKGGPSCSH